MGAENVWSTLLSVIWLKCSRSKRLKQSFKALVPGRCDKSEWYYKHLVFTMTEEEEEEEEESFLL